MPSRRFLDHGQGGILEQGCSENRRGARAFRFVPDQFALPEDDALNLLVGGARNADEADSESEKCQRQKTNTLTRAIETRGGCNLEKGCEISQGRERSQGQYRKSTADLHAGVEEHDRKAPPEEQNWSHQIHTEQQHAVDALHPAQLGAPRGRQHVTNHALVVSLSPPHDLANADGPSLRYLFV